MSKDQLFALAIMGAAGALVVAIGVSRLFLGYATETYTLAIQRIGSPGIQAAGELYKIHRAAIGEVSLRGFLARSIDANGGLVYTRNTKCDPKPCEGFGCIWTQCGTSMIYAEDFIHVSYYNSIVEVPSPKTSLWIYTLMAGAIIGLGVGSVRRWVRLLTIGVIIGAPLLVLAVPLSPTIITILLGAVAGGISALLAKGIILHFEPVAPQRHTAGVA